MGLPTPAIPFRETKNFGFSKKYAPIMRRRGGLAKNGPGAKARRQAEKGSDDRKSNPPPWCRLASTAAAVFAVAGQAPGEAPIGQPRSEETPMKKNRLPAAIEPVRVGWRSPSKRESDASQAAQARGSRIFFGLCPRKGGFLLLGLAPPFFLSPSHAVPGETANPRGWRPLASLKNDVFASRSFVALSKSQTLSEKGPSAISGSPCVSEPRLHKNAFSATLGLAWNLLISEEPFPPPLFLEKAVPPARKVRTPFGGKRPGSGGRNGQNFFAALRKATKK